MKKLILLILSALILVGCHSNDIDPNIIYEVPSDIDITYSKGNANASVVITEYSDYECPYCSTFTLETLPLLQSDYIETDKVLFIFKDYPIPAHQKAQIAAEATYCAGDQREDAFWEMHVKLFANQENIELEDLIAYAEEMGLEINSFSNCLDTEKYRSLVLRNLQQGAELGVAATPTLFINDIKVVGLQPYEYLVELIEQELKI